MNKLGIKIAEKRKNLGMTQIGLAEQMHVTRQTVSRWEAGTALPDIDKIGEIADILGVSCDYLLRDDAVEPNAGDTDAADTDAGETEAKQARSIGRLLKSLTGKTVRLMFFDEEADADLYNTPCRVMDFEGSWMRITADTKKGSIEKLIPVSSVLSVEIVKEEN